MYYLPEDPNRTSTEMQRLISALGFLKEHRIGQYFQSEKTIDSAIEIIDQRNSEERLRKKPEITELRGLCAALLRRQPQVIDSLKIQPSYPEIARILGYYNHSGAMRAVKKYAQPLENALAERHLV